MICQKSGVSTTLLRTQTLLWMLKNAISSGLVKEKIDQVKTSSVILDIGAEQSAPELRDEDLFGHSQHHAENLPTFYFFSFADLERHFASSKNGDETWQASRLWRGLSFWLGLRPEGENRR